MGDVGAQECNADFHVSAKSNWVDEHKFRLKHIELEVDIQVKMPTMLFDKSSVKYWFRRSLLNNGYLSHACEWYILHSDLSVGEESLEPNLLGTPMNRGER